MKKLLAMLLALTMAFVLVACGSEDTPGTEATDQTDNTNEELMDVGDVDASDVDVNALDLGEYTKEKPLKIRLATSQTNEMNQQNLLADAFKERVETWSDGAIIVDLYKGTVGSDREIVDQVIAGTLDMGVNNTAIMANYNRLFDVLDLAYLIRDYDDVYDVMESEIWAEMMGEFSATGAALLGLQCTGFRTITTTDEAGMVHNLAELKGKTIRITEGKIFLENYTAWGAVPVSMSAGEIMSSLQNGTIDGVDHVPAILYASNGQQEYAKNVALFGLAAHFTGLDMNNSLLESLPSGAREIIMNAAQEAVIFRSKALQEDNETYIKKLNEEYGVQFYQPTEAEIQEMIDAMQPVYDNFVKTHEFGAYAKAIRDLCESN